jgi:hypothetical protein
MADPLPEDLDALIRDHFARPEVAAQEAAALAAAMQTAQRAPEPHPATPMPVPEFPRFGVARYHCPRRCGWFHEEPTDPGPTRLIVAFDPGGEGVGEVITFNAEARALAFRERVEGAIAAHYAAAH